MLSRVAAAEVLVDGVEFAQERFDAFLGDANELVGELEVLVGLELFGGAEDEVNGSQPCVEGRMGHFAALGFESGPTVANGEVSRRETMRVS